MTDKVQKIRDEVVRIHNLLPVMDGDNISLNYAYMICNTLEMYIDSLQKEPVGRELEEAATNYATHFDENWSTVKDGYIAENEKEAFKAGANWLKANLWKDAQGDDLPEIDREVIALTQPYSDDNEHLRVVFAHRPNKYAKVWNSDFGEEQVVEIERYDKGGWNIPNVKYWADMKVVSRK